VGKSVIFGIITGRYVTVSNYPGTTVEITRGNAKLLGKRSQVIDTPGVTNLIPNSEDERVTRDILMEEAAQRVIQVADTKNLRRSLLISLELIEMGIPMMLVLNMEDEARSLGVEIDHSRLSHILGIPVVTTVATQGKGIDRMINKLDEVCSGRFEHPFTDEIEEAIHTLESLLPETHVSRRSLAVMLLAGDETLSGWLHAHVTDDHVNAIEDICRRLQTQFEEPLAYIANRMRLQAVDSIVEQVVHKRERQRVDWVQRLGNLSMHPIWGIPILLGVLALLYYFVGDFGAQTLVELLEERLFGEFLLPWVVRASEVWLPIPFLRDLLLGQYGIITMALTYAIAIILPIVGTFFIAFGILEDSGYMPRLAVMANRIFRTIGLSGKAVLPMLLGLGCDTMATLTTRILETRKERILVTLLLALGVPCSAQLGVILGMLGTLSIGALYLWAGVIVLTMLVVGYAASRLIPGEEGSFILELPPIRLPQPKNILVKTLARIEWYLKEAVPLFILGTLVLFFLDKMALLGLIQSGAEPLVKGWLGLPNQATEAFLIGFLRRDYGAAGLYALAQAGTLNSQQILVSLVTITLFVPCIANSFIIIKERGWRTALWMLVIIFPLAFGIGGLLNQILKWTGWSP
jgi:ferrous iron transport protein B